MAAVAELDLAGLDVAGLRAAHVEEQGRDRAAAGIRRPQHVGDCEAMARMPLPALLYHVLVGEGRSSRSLA
jgi:hypothetical protein